MWSTRSRGSKTGGFFPSNMPGAGTALTLPTGAAADDGAGIGGIGGGSGGGGFGGAYPFPPRLSTTQSMGQTITTVTAVATISTPTHANTNAAVGGGGSGGGGGGGGGSGSGSARHSPVPGLHSALSGGIGAGAGAPGISVPTLLISPRPSTSGSLQLLHTNSTPRDPPHLSHAPSFGHAVSYPHPPPTPPHPSHGPLFLNTRAPSTPLTGIPIMSVSTPPHPHTPPPIGWTRQYASLRVSIPDLHGGPNAIVPLAKTPTPRMASPMAGGGAGYATLHSHGGGGADRGGQQQWHPMGPASLVAHIMATPPGSSHAHMDSEDGRAAVEEELHVNGPNAPMGIAQLSAAVSAAAVATVGGATASAAAVAGGATVPGSSGGAGASGGGGATTAVPPCGYAISIRKGRRKKMQDAYAAIPVMYAHNAPPASLFGVFDGHGKAGHTVAQMAAKQMTEHVLSVFAAGYKTPPRNSLAAPPNANHSGSSTVSGSGGAAAGGPRGSGSGPSSGSASAATGTSPLQGPAPAPMAVGEPITIVLSNPLATGGGGAVATTATGPAPMAVSAGGGGATAAEGKDIASFLLSDSAIPAASAAAAVAANGGGGGSGTGSAAATPFGRRASRTTSISMSPRLVAQSSFSSERAAVGAPPATAMVAPLTVLSDGTMIGANGRPVPNRMVWECDPKAAFEHVFSMLDEACTSVIDVRAHANARTSLCPASHWPVARRL
jgi:hypothetical protein